ncbi:phage gp6-like head-tail connector protein [Cronobacter sakazakii]|nr:phage gp6-like head-tail connector protein [Cronobacter sakazakii]EKM5753109.1 phage gp6-like head-tail connector protein [Cronobacter sakazakii]EKY1951545.1 phage gp6-like head-tail connector protein [Cronobacter sakazakii]EKY1956809.1 phage gp6-like head-tail connector protein [Cronobacter sakazakii]EKY1959478.1 phage gp6-like head-tail connector protein [Cronobacter sakazakii]
MDVVNQLQTEADTAKSIKALAGNRRLYATEVPDTDEDGLVVSDDIRQAMLMLCSHFYENRSSTSDVEMTEMPQSFKWLVDAYRFIPL